ncbi:unnamed protein product [Closterium sp. NIES-64]|nr:unnamed protein product [Closterium sp. NIES-64]
MAHALAGHRLLPVVVAVFLMVFVKAAPLKFTVKSTVNGGDEAAINVQVFPSRHLVGRVGEFEGELNYYLPTRLRNHRERVNLVVRPLGCPLDASRLSNVFMGFFKHLHAKPSPASFNGTPIKPSEASCVTSRDISGGGSSDSSNGSAESSSSGYLRNGIGNVTSAAADSASMESAAAESVPGESDWVKKLGCHGPPCPSFGSCTARFPNVQACWNPHLVDEPETKIAPPMNCPYKNDSIALEKWRKGAGLAPFDETCSSRRDFNPRVASALQVMRLEDVFMTHNGSILNRTHVFVRNGCGRFPRTVKYEANHMVHHVPTVFN